MTASQNYGVREIMNVVLKDFKTRKPVAYFESLTTSSFEISAQSASARGGQGNPERIVWDSEKDIAMNMTDSLISKSSLEVLTGSKFTKGAKLVHKKEVIEVEKEGSALSISLAKIPVVSAKYPIFFFKTQDGSNIGEELTASNTGAEVTLTGVADIEEGDKVIVDYYYEAPATTQSIKITSDVFPGTYYLEGTTFWRNEDGYDIEAIYTIPKLKVLPGFTIGMASSGDPQPFDFGCKVLKDSNSTEMIIIDLLEEE